MDHHRVSRGWRYSFLALIVALLGFTSHLSYAVVPQLTEWQANAYDIVGVWGDQVTSCQSWVSKQPSTYGAAQYVGVNPAGRLCMYKYHTQWNFNSDEIGFATRLICPANSVLTGGSCTCNVGYAEDATHTACVPECLPPKRWISVKQFDGSYVSTCAVPQKCDWAKNETMMTFGTFQIQRGKNLCISGCDFMLKIDAGSPAESARLNANSPWVDTRTMGDFFGSGAECMDSQIGASTPSKTDAPLNKCPAGQLPGTVNGLTVCAKSGESVEGTETTVNTPGDASDPNSVISETTNNVTTCTGSGSCTTTTTVTSTHYDGTTTTATSDKTQSESSYCAANPSANVCKGGASGAFAGACGTPPVCSGDAVQCAVAEATFSTNCVIAGTDNDPDSVVNMALSGRDETNTGVMKAAAAGSPVNVGSFDATGQGWSRSCPADPVIVLSWASASNSQFAIPFSKLCANGLLALLSNGALALTMLGSLVFVVGGKQSAAA